MPQRMQASRFKKDLASVFAEAYSRVTLSVPPPPVIERSRRPDHGHFCCPLALSAARSLKMLPRALAEKIIAEVQLPAWVKQVEVAGAGFINITLTTEALVSVVAEVLSSGEDFARGRQRNETICLEFVSANPTGPLHVGHGRACAYGDSVANILAFAGYHVQREYYVNDAGRQMDVIVVSLWVRYWQQQMQLSLPSGLYQGEYVRHVAKQLKSLLCKTTPPPTTLMQQVVQEEDIDALIRACEVSLPSGVTMAMLRKHACASVLEEIIKPAMKNLGVDVQSVNFCYESDFYARHLVSHILHDLDLAGYTYTADGALWLRSTAFGDEKDRVIRRRNGDLTYLAADIAYHVDKVRRFGSSAGRLINVLGADHHGYIPRLRAALQSLGMSPHCLEVRIIQFVCLVEEGKRLKMSTRAADYVTLDDLIEAIGADAARYFYVTRKNDQHFDFDLAVARSADNTNPMYYIHYAYARIHSLMRKWGGQVDTLVSARLATLATDAGALKLCERLLQYVEITERAASDRAPHGLATYLHELAADFHGYYEKTRILGDAGEREKLALVWSVALVIKGGMDLLGVRLSEKM